MNWFILYAATLGCSPSSMGDDPIQPVSADPTPAAAPHADPVIDSGAAPFPAAADEYVAGQIIIGFDEAVPQVVSLDSGELRDRPLQLIHTIGQQQAGLYLLPDDIRVPPTVDALEASGRFRYVEPNYRITALGQVDDPYRALQWGLDTVQAEAAWELSTGSDIVVAVIDSGVRSDGIDGIHAISGGWDYIDDDADATDDTCGHGTHVAGTIAQASNNGIGTAGLAHHATIMPFRILSYDSTWGVCGGSIAQLADAVDLAVSSGAHVINMSLGSSVGSTTIETAVGAAHDAGLVVVAAAGNSGNSTPVYPAAYDGVISVGAVDYNHAVAWYSSYGATLDLVAPGGDTWVDENGDGWADGILQETFDPAIGAWDYAFYEGTSMAAPHVAASAALLMSVCATRAQVEDYLIDTSVDLGSAGWDQLYGHGLIQTGDALAALLDDTDADGDGYADPAGDALSFCVRPACVADFNGDGVVDAADYTVWADNEGCSSCSQGEGDASGDGVVDDTDHALWQEHFGGVCTSG